jgi:hypothetical protein
MQPRAWHNRPCFRFPAERAIIPPCEQSRHRYQMTLPQVEAAVEDLQHANRELLAVVDALSDDDWERYVPYGEWTVKDLVAHAIGDMSPSGPGLIHAGIITPEFIEETSRTFDIRARNDAMVEERRRLTREDLRQMLFHAHDAFIEAAFKLNESNLPVLDYDVPMGPGYTLKVVDWLWRGYHDRQHADDIRRALDIDYNPPERKFVPEVVAAFGVLSRGRDGLLRVIYSVADDAWDEPAAENPEWTNRDVLAHLAANDLRAHVRFRALLGEADESEVEAVNRTDEWNQARVDARSGRSIRQLIDELVANREQTMALLARMRPEHVSQILTLSRDRTVTIPSYLPMFREHESMHAGQLVPASRARRQS